jgi:hypothetical protein
MRGFEGTAALAGALAQGLGENWFKTAGYETW